MKWSFVATQEDLDAALLLEENGQEEMVQFLKSIGAIGKTNFCMIL